MGALVSTSALVTTLTALAGITISDQDISSIASSYLADHPPTSAEPWADNAKLFLSFKSLDSLRWADKARLKPNFDVAFLERFGPKPDPKARGKVCLTYRAAMV